MDGSTRGSRVIRLAAVAPLSLVLLVFPALGAAQNAPSAAELYDAQLGCGGCHGELGDGAMGPPLQETEMPLREFVRLVRAPRELMPRFSPIIVSDAELADIYVWLNGTDDLETPLPLELEVEGFGAVGAADEAAGTFTVQAAERSGHPRATRERPVRFRLTLTAQQGDRPLSGHGVGYRFAGDRDWREATTDDGGQVVVRPDDDLQLADFAGSEQRSTDLRIPALPAGRYAVVFEALDWSEPSSPTVVAIGSAVVTVD